MTLNIEYNINSRYVMCPGVCGNRVEPSRDPNEGPLFCCVPCWNTLASNTGLNRMEPQDYGHSEQCDRRQASRNLAFPLTEDR